MLVHGKIRSTHVNGPGDRSLIHVQGCTLGCDGCWNPDTHAFDNSKEIDNDELLSWIFENAEDGVTFSGGEPMQQAHDLQIIIRDLKALRPDLSIGMYTGYSLKELDSYRYQYIHDPRPSCSGWHPWASIKKNIDFAVMGRFNKHQIDISRPLLSSKNQELVLFSDKYKQSDFQEQEIEFQISGGLVHITGFPIEMPDLLEVRNW